jgi:hypothetical protein
MLAFCPLCDHKRLFNNWALLAWVAKSKPKNAKAQKQPRTGAKPTY